MVAGRENGADGGGGVTAVDLDGSVSAFASGIDDANFPAPTPWGTLLVSSLSGDAIYEVTAAGVVSRWTDIPSPNGIAPDPSGAQVYVARTYGPPDELNVVEVDAGAALGVSPFASFPADSAQDGLAMDADGALYVALSGPGEIARVGRDGAVATLAIGTERAASLAFGVGSGWSPCSLYVTSLSADTLFEVGAL